MVTQFVRLLLLFFFCQLAGISSREQTSPGGYSLTNYNSDNALPQNSINGMAFDKNGFLWLATKKGIVRFDGSHFREYNMENCAAVTGDEYSLPQPAGGTGNVRFKQVNNSRAVLTVTEDAGVETDSLLSGLPCQFTTSNNHLFYSAALRRAASLKNDSGKYNALLDKLDYSKAPLTINEKQAYCKDNDDCWFLDENTGSITALSEIAAHRLKLQLAVGNIFIYVDDQYRVYAYKDGVWQKEITVTGELHRLLIRAAGVDPDPVMASLKIRRDGSHTLMVCGDSILQVVIRNHVLDAKILAAHMPVRDIKCMIYDEGYDNLYIGTITSGIKGLENNSILALLR